MYILTCRYDALEAALLVDPGPEYILGSRSLLLESEQHQQHGHPCSHRQ